MSAARRRVNEYRQYLEGKRDCPARIPYRTWRSWLAKGRITVTELLEMGIHPGHTRRKGGGRKPRQQAPVNPHLPVRTSSEESGFAEHAPEARPSTSTVSEEEDAAGDLNSTYSVWSNSDGSDCENQASASWLGTEDGNSATDIDSGDDSSDADGGDSARISSILESKNIGVDALNSPFVDGSRLTKFEVMLMIFHLTMRHGCTDAHLEDLISFANEISGVPNAIPGSKFLFHKLFKFGSEPTVHFFCPDCEKYLGPKSQFQRNVECEECNWTKTASSLNDNNYFLTIPIREQLKEVLSRDLKFSPRDIPDEHLADISHGQVYRKLRQGVLSNPDALSITISTDGSPVFKNGPNTLYPVHFHLNEIVPQDRFNVDNLLLAGLWFSKKGEPDLQIFLKPIVNELLELESHGVAWRKPNGVSVRSPIYLTCVCADSVARPKIQNVMQFNAAYGCSYCLHPNTSIVVSEPLKRGHGIRAAELESDSDSDVQDTGPVQLTQTRQMKRYVVGADYPLRTDQSVKEHMQMAENLEVEHFYGVRGKNVLSSVNSLHLVFGYPIDYMHNVLAGITKRLATLWFDSKSSKQDYYIGLKIAIVDKRLSLISPPSHLPPPRSMSKRGSWKCKEWAAFLLYYGLPCLFGVLPDKYYKHFKLLVTAIFILNKEAIRFDEAAEAEQILKDFVNEYQTLYCEKNMVYNVHLASHLGRQVAWMGPLWNYCLFHFEGANGRLVKLVKGTRGVATQIARKYLMSHSVSKILQGGLYTVQDSVLKFCSNVVEYKYSKNLTSCDDIQLQGRPSLLQLSDDHRELLINSGCCLKQKVFEVYNRVHYKRHFYSSRMLGRQKVFNDSCVRLEDGSFAMINYIVAIDKSEVWCVGEHMNIALDGILDMPPHIKECAIDAFGSSIAFPLKKVVERCMFMSVSDKHYVAQLPNTFEKS